MRGFICLLACVAGATAQTRVWTGPNVNLLGGPSPDGQWLSYVDAADLAIRNATETRRLTHRPAGSKEFAYFSVFAPDSKRIAYAWMNSDGFYEVRVTSIEGEAPKTIYRNEETGFVQPCAWSPDGSQILTLLFRRDNTSQIALIPASGDGRPKILRSLPWIYPKKMDFSPDGRWIVYDRFRYEGQPDRAVYLLAADGSQETPLLAENAPSHLFPLWTPDGRRIVYINEADASLHAITVQQGKREGEPQQLAQGLGRILPMAISRGGELFYGLRLGQTDIATKNGPIATKFKGLNSAPAWSPDGETLAYLSRRGTENYGQESRVIVLNKNNEERELPWSLALMEAVGWESNDAILISGADSKGREGTFRLKLDNGEITWLKSERSKNLGDKTKAWTVGEQSNAVFKLKLPEPKLRIPAGLDAFLPVPPGNPLTAEKAALGKQLFFDPRLSRDNTISCATCHQPDYAFADPHKTAIGIQGQKGDRRTPRIANRAYGYSFFWDGRAKTLEEQVTQPIENPKEMALPVAEAAARVGLSVESLRQSLASYVRTILSGDSAYDRYILGDTNALKPNERAGLKLFQGKAGCSACHVGPNLTDEKLHDTGIGSVPVKVKTPSLRDVAQAPPYMHDGSIATLAEVIEHYDRGNRVLPRLNLTPAERHDLEAFLHSLNGRKTDGFR